MGLLCRLFGKSWQAYYQHKDTSAKQRLTEEMVVEFVREIRTYDRGIGGAKLHEIYVRRASSSSNSDRVAISQPRVAGEDRYPG